MSDVHFVVVEYYNIEHSTDKAVLFDFEGEMIWWPRSQIEKIEYEKSRVWIPKWLAKEKGLSYE